MATVAPTLARPGRRSEFFLLILALLISFYGYAQAGLALTKHVPVGIYVQAGVFTALALAGHFVLRWRAPYADQVIYPITVLLNGIGLTMIYRLSLSYKASASKYTRAFAGVASNQLKWTVIGVIFAFIVLIVLRDHRIFRRYTYTAGLVAILCLLLPMVPGLGESIQGSRIWIHIGSMSFQPGEATKIFLCIFFAGYLVAKRDTLALAGKKVLGLHLPRLRDFGPILIAWGASLGVLVMQSDLGTSLLLFGLFVVMLFVATDRPSWILIGMVMFSGGVAVAYKMFAHVQARFDIWLHPFSNALYNKPVGGSGQLVTGIFGMANGGLLGTGWGYGRPDLTPLGFSDFIATSLGEELGLTGMIAILACYLILAERGFRTAIGVRDGFGKLLATGLSFVIVFQVFIIVGGVTRVIPMTGLVTPFLAAGGSALVANWVIVAILLRISDGARRPAPATNEIDLTPVIEAEKARLKEEEQRVRAAKDADHQVTQAVERP